MATLEPFAERFEVLVAEYRAALEIADVFAHALLDGRTNTPDKEVRETARVMIENYARTMELDHALRQMVNTLGIMSNQSSVLRPDSNRLRTALQNLADTTPTQFAWADDAEALLAKEDLDP